METRDSEQQVKAGSGPKLSLCMIVKNEEASLGRCLESARAFVDEIVVVDTGSTDRTVEIAAGYGARLYHHPWEHDFSKHRNQSLSYATGEWILQLDADEVLQLPEATSLREAMADPEADAFQIGILCFTEGQTSESYHRFPRLFRNNGLIHYEGIVHNQVVGYRNLRESGIRIVHYGYDVGQEDREKRFKRTAPLLLEQIRRKPADPLPYIYLSTSFLTLEGYDRALDCSARAISLMKQQNLYPRLGSVAYYNQAICFLNRNAFGQMVSLGRECLEIYPDDVDACLVLVFGYRGLGKWREVIRWGADYLEKTGRLDQVGSGVVLSLADVWKAQLFMGEACLHLGDHDRAGRHFAAALKADVQRETCLGALIRILTAQGLHHLAKPYVQAAIREGLAREAVQDYASGRAAQGIPAAEMPPEAGDHRGAQGTRPLLSLCMIVRNEAQWLARCIASVRPIVAQVIVVDTGSGDDTKKIAAAMGAEVYDYPWQGDFAAARNHALAKAQGEWTLVLDADEVLADRDRERLTALIAEGRADAYRLLLRNYVLDGNLANAVPNPGDYAEGEGYPGFIPASLIRLFRTDPAVRFTGRVHESLDAAFAGRGKQILDAAIPIHHYGKVAMERIQAKKELYAQLGREKVREQPENPVAYKTYVDQCLEMGLNEEALEYAGKGLSLAPGYAELHFDRGLALERSGRPQEAEGAYGEALRLDDRHVGACNNLAASLTKRGALAEAEALLQRAGEKGLRHPALHYTRGLVAVAGRRDAEALVHFDAALVLFPGLKKANLQKALIHLQRKEIARAERCLQREIENHGEVVPALLILGEICLEGKDLAQADDYFRRVLALEPGNRTAEAHRQGLRNDRDRAAALD